MVFPNDALGVEALIAHVRATCIGSKRFDVTIGGGEVVWDSVGTLWLYQLVPTQGNNELIALHDALYTNQLAPLLRTDIPYAPHITVVASQDKDECGAAADDLRGKIEGRTGWVQAIDVIEFDGALNTIERIPLAG